MQGAKGVL